MLEQDYILRLFQRLILGIQNARHRKNKDPRVAADMLEALISDAIGMNMQSMFALSGESFASVVHISGIDPRIVEFVVRSLMLESEYLKEASLTSRASLREEQARALAKLYNIEIDEFSVNEDEIEEFCTKIAH